MATIVESNAHPDWARKGLSHFLDLYRDANSMNHHPLDPGEVRAKFIDVLGQMLSGPSGENFRGEIAKEEARDHAAAEAAKNQPGG